ncbi:MAG: phosphatidate cytidylyltransferase [Caldilineaceae bacterium]|nr:phosphatidate cytidylyltransferase [Caldilineaceae bacterium]
MLRYWEMARVEIRPWLWSLLLLLYCAAILPSQVVTLLILGFISFQALKEYFSIIPMRQAERPLLLLGYLSIPLQFICVGFSEYGLALGFTPLYILVLSIVGLQRFGRTPQTLNSILKIGWGVFTLVYAFSYIGLLAQWPVREDLAGNGVRLLLFFLTMIHLQSAVRFLLERWGIDIWPRNVFNSTLDGMGGAASILATGVFAWSVGPWFTGLEPQSAMLAGLVVSTAAYIGTATVRAVQQALYISEEEHLLPGMGGILNLVYPFVYAAPLLFFLLLALYR